jgi:hypothetical protein
MVDAAHIEICTFKFFSEEALVFLKKQCHKTGKRLRAGSGDHTRQEEEVRKVGRLDVPDAVFGHLLFLFSSGWWMQPTCFF